MNALQIEHYGSNTKLILNGQELQNVISLRLTRTSPGDDLVLRVELVIDQVGNCDFIKAETT